MSLFSQPSLRHKVGVLLQLLKNQSISKNYSSSANFLSLSPYKFLPSSCKSLSNTTLSTRAYSTTDKISPNKDDLDAPIKFTTSEASAWTAEDIQYGKRGERRAWYESYIVLISTGSVLLWFGLLRDENDIDEEIGKTLWEKIPDLEKKQILMLIPIYKSEGKSTEELEKRLAQIRAMEKK